jgi:cytochrome oxidase Cu insertion factor (SCO1/SenC/PrrC family)
MATQVAPDFTLEHISGRQYSLSQFRGKPVVVVMSGRYSFEQALAIENGIRDRYTHEQVPVINVADMRVPKLLRGVAKKDIEKGFKVNAPAMAQRIQSIGGQPPADLADAHVVLLDWDAKVTTDYNTGDVQKQAVAVLIDPQGAMRGYFTGPQAKDQILSQFG